MKKNLFLPIFIGTLLSAGGLYLAFRNVPAGELIAYLASIHYIWILPSLAVALVSFVFRVLRWQVILESVKKIRFWSGFHPLMIGFAVNGILPGRVGELVRPAILMKKENVPYSTGLATVAVERILDVGFIVILFIIALQFIHIDPDMHVSMGKYELNNTTLKSIVNGMLRLSLVFIIGMMLVTIQWTRERIKQLTRKMPALFFFAGDRFKEKIFEKICAPFMIMLDNFAAGFELIRSPTRLCMCLGFSVAVWGFGAFSYYLFSLGCPGIELSFFEVAAMMVIICIFIALPSVPGYWGLWEAGGIFALALFGIPHKEAVGFTLANHAMQIFPIIFFGMVSAMITGVNIWRASFPTGNYLRLKRTDQ